MWTLWLWKKKDIVLFIKWTLLHYIFNFISLLYRFVVTSLILKDILRDQSLMLTPINPNKTWTLYQSILSLRSNYCWVAQIHIKRILYNDDS